MMGKRLLIAAAVVLLSVLPVSAQKWSVQTNLLDYLALGTLNAEVGMSVSQHFSIFAGGRFNPWEFKAGDPEVIVRNQQQTAYLGMRYWTWYVNSGFWAGIKAQYLNFSNTGIWREALKEGRGGIGGGLSAYGQAFAQHHGLQPDLPLAIGGKDLRPNRRDASGGQNQQGQSRRPDMFSHFSCPPYRSEDER